MVDMETLLKGTCSKSNLLDLFENFIVYDESAGTVAKILARNHQFLGVNRAVESVRNRNGLNGKLGVFWHTQGIWQELFNGLFHTQGASQARWQLHVSDSDRSR